ncbi:Uncharacterised protein [Chryseobacterium gleum]|uniref:Uncharacterized protein n=2 Tax=Chryseobacterium gleum TaxID=250 RepID=A0A3S5E314_CHRGE|nr:hypothetical protein HMPREF0204_10379 [Chryseobacterium gleum ATCC 35910]VEE09846.1 Uncharacterised protein [Chryseobacterium gleum]
MLHKMMMKCLFQVMNRQIHLNAAILRFSSRFGGLVYFGQDPYKIYFYIYNHKVHP